MKNTILSQEFKKKEGRKTYITGEIVDENGEIYVSSSSVFIYSSVLDHTHLTVDIEELSCDDPLEL